MIDISKLLSVRNIELCSHITNYNESMLMDGNICLYPAKRHDWKIRVDFGKVILDNCEHICILNIDNIKFSSNDWTSIRNEKFDIDTQEDSEATFYLCEHHTIDYYNCIITHVKDNVFNMSLEFDITIRNFFKEPIKASGQITKQVKYLGLEVQLYNLEPNTDIQIKGYIKDCVDLSIYSEPQIRSQYLCIIEPRV